MNIVIWAAIGLVAGVLSGLLGVGGGVIMVPAMVALLAFTQQQAQGTSLAAIVPAALAGAVVYHFRGGHVQWPVAVAMGLAAMVGSWLLGAPLATKLDADLLKRLFGVLLIVVGLRMAGVVEFVAAKLTGGH